MRQGDILDDFTATLDDGREIRFFELLAKGPAVVFFYPKSFTPGCTAESCHFRDLAKEFAEVGAQRIGVSRDDVATQTKFRSEYGLDFPLIADTDGAVAKLFGAKRPGNLWSKRQTFVVGSDGTVLDVISSEMNMDVHADKALEVLRGEQSAPQIDVEIDLTAQPALDEQGGRTV